MQTLPDEDGFKGRGRKQNAFTWLLLQQRSETTGASTVTTNKYTGKKGVFQITMICVGMSASGVGNRKDMHGKGLQEGFILGFSEKCLPGLFAAEISFPQLQLAKPEASANE